MAENKRVFQIKINGLTESTDAVKALKEQLSDVEGIIKNLQNAEIKVKVSAGDTQQKAKVSSGKNSTDTDKAALELEKEKTKQLELQNEAIREQILQKEQLKQSNKQELDDIKQQAKGYTEVVDGVKTYANTLNGMSAELKDIKKELRNTDIGTEAFDELTEKAADLNKRLKEAEEAYGQFGRNVGNYTQSITDALEDWDANKDFHLDFNITGAEGSLRDLKQQLSELKQYWADLSPDNANFDKTSKAIQSLNRQIQDMESNLKDAGDAANTAFTGRFTTTIGGVEASFSNASEACEALRKKLVAMRVAGEQNTPMYQEIIELTRRLQKEVQAANKEVEGMTNTTRNIGKVVGVLKGLSGIASLGQGIAGLFGGQSEELDKFIQKFASLTLVLNGVSAIEEELNKNSSSFAKSINWLNESFDKTIAKIPYLKEFSGTIQGALNAKIMMEAEEGMVKATDAVMDFIEAFDGVKESLYTQISLSKELSDIYLNLSEQDKDKFEMAGSLDELRDGSAELSNFADALQKASENDAEFSEILQENFELQKKYTSVSKEHQLAVEKYKEAQAQNAKITGRFSQALVRMASTSKVAAMAIRGVALAINTLAKATVILALIQALGVAIEWLFDVAKKAWDGLKSLFGIMSDDSAKKLATDIDNLQHKLDALNKEYDIQIKLGNMGETEAQLKALEDRLKSLAETKKLLDNQDEMSEWQEQLIENLDKESKAWGKLTEDEKKAAEAMQQIAKLDPSFFSKLKDLKPEQQLKEIENALGGDVTKLAALEGVLGQDDEAIDKFLDKLSDIDYDLNDIGVEGVKAFGKLGTAINQARNQAAQAAAKIRQDLQNLTKQEYTLRLSLDATDFETRMELVKMEMQELARQYGMKINSDGSVSKKQGGRMSDDEKEVAQRIANINAMQKKQAKLQDQQAKQQKADEAKRKREEAAREAKQRADEAKRAADEARKRARAEANARIEAMQDGLAKELAAIAQKRKEELEDAKETGKSIVDINTIYDRQELEVKKKYAKFIEDEQREHNKRLMEIAQNFLSEWKQIQRQIEDTEADTSMGKNENNNIQQKQNTTYDTNAQGTAELQGYYDGLKNVQIDYINEKEKLDKEASEREHQRRIEDADKSFQSLAKQYADELEEQKRALQEKVDNAQITQEMANKEIEELEAVYADNIQKAEIQLYEERQSIMEHGEAELKNIELQALEERQQAHIEAFNNQLDAVRDYYDKVDKTMERYQKRNTNQFGFINYSDYRKSLKDALKVTEETAAEIEAKKKELQQKLDANEISFDDFQKANKELDEFAEDVKDKTKELQDTLSGSFNTWLSGVLDAVNQYAQVLSGMFDTISEMYTRELDAQQDALDKKQELLDEELEMIEEKLQKQQEITEEYSDKINDTEDELKTARGDRRQALIDSLAAQKKAQEESMAAEKKLVEEQKKNAAKQEALKKQQDALDKKRKQQEKRSAIVQATINTFTAVSNALAVQPWFVGLALSAVALGLGMANVAQISAQKYADGGLLNGRSHARGGMRIQGSNIEVEGGEYVTNKQSTSANLPLLEYINSNRRTLTREDLARFYDNGQTSLINQPMKRKFEEGGQLPQMAVDVQSLMDKTASQGEDRQMVVSVVDIINQMENVQQVRVLAGDTDND